MAFLVVYVAILYTELDGQHQNADDRYAVAVIKAGATVGRTALQEYLCKHDLINIHTGYFSYWKSIRVKNFRTALSVRKYFHSEKKANYGTSLEDQH